MAGVVRRDGLREAVGSSARPVVDVLPALLAAAFVDELSDKQRRWCIDYALNLHVGPMPNEETR